MPFYYFYYLIQVDFNIDLPPKYTTDHILNSIIEITSVMSHERCQWFQQYRVFNNKDTNKASTKNKLKQSVLKFIFFVFSKKNKKKNKVFN